MADSLRFETKVISSLMKVFPSKELRAPRYKHATAFVNENFAFQVAFRGSRLIKPLHAFVSADDDSRVSLREVGLVPSELPCYHDPDERILTDALGLYPDPLYPLKDKELAALPNQWHSLWVNVLPVEPGSRPVTTIRIAFHDDRGTELGGETFRLRRINAKLPQQRLVHTEWLYADCLASLYGDPVFSEAHWERIGQYARTAAEHGINMLLTPIFTPPLDTEVGGERPTVQLVDVERLPGGEYRFGYGKLERWISLCESNGIRYFEFSHLFTQWGAKHAPKIEATVNGAAEKIFGWHTNAADAEYERFLDCFLPDLVWFIKSRGMEDRCYFHISDEPGKEHAESYRRAAEIAGRHLTEFPVIDALSDIDFYDLGIVKIPVPSNDHLEPFVERGIEELWTYYCCAQYKRVPNRFFHMPSSRNRVMGILAYRYRLAGFLHWGFNFWYAQYSKYPVDPFRTTDAGRAFPSGDAFLVYPGPEGPIESIRLEVLNEAMQDLRALELLEQVVGRDEVMRLIEKTLGYSLSMNDYPIDDGVLLLLREQINLAVENGIAQRRDNIVHV